MVELLFIIILIFVGRLGVDVFIFVMSIIIINIYIKFSGEDDYSFVGEFYGVDIFSWVLVILVL
jgi:hypothetical protein